MVFGQQQQLTDPPSSYSQAVGWFGQLQHVPTALFEEGLLRLLLREGLGAQQEEEGEGEGGSGLGSLLAALQGLSEAGLLVPEKQQALVEKVGGGAGRAVGGRGPFCCDGGALQAVPLG